MQRQREHANSSSSASQPRHASGTAVNGGVERSFRSRPAVPRTSGSNTASPKATSERRMLRRGCRTLPSPTRFREARARGRSPPRAH
eukprot:3619221-Prymnesium_polylepis.1